MRNIRIVAVVPSVPRRAANMRALVDSLLSQTLYVDDIYVCLDGYESVERFSDPRVVVMNSPIAAGPGQRWKLVASSVESSSVVVSLDDDLSIDADYVERSVSALLRADVALISWTGHTSPRRYVDLGPSERDRRLWTAGTGTATVWARYIKGIQSHEWADRCLCQAGDEEALVSLWIWQQQAHMVRPALSGASPVRHVPNLQYDALASHKIHGADWAARRMDMMQQYGWYGCES